MPYTVHIQRPLKLEPLFFYTFLSVYISYMPIIIFYLLCFTEFYFISNGIQILFHSVSF